MKIRSLFLTSILTTTTMLTAATTLSSCVDTKNKDNISRLSATGYCKVTFVQTTGVTVIGTKVVQVKKNKMFGTVKQPIAKKENHTFIGWNQNPEATEGISASTPITTSLNLYPIFENKPQQPIVTFDTSECTSVSGPTTAVVESGSLWKDCPRPNVSKDGSNFIGWYNGDTKMEDQMELTENLTLKPKFEEGLPIGYSYAQFDPNGGTFSSGSSEKSIYKNGTEWKTLNKPQVEKSNFSFEGWYFDAECTERVGDDYILPAGGKKFYANYKAAKAEKIDISCAKFIEQNKTMVCKAIPTPSYATCPPLKWTSSNTAVATIDETGANLTAIKPGNVKITATATDDSGLSAYIWIKVGYTIEGGEFTTCDWKNISNCTDAFELGALSEEEFCSLFTINGTKPKSIYDFVNENNPITRTITINSQKHTVKLIGVLHDELSATVYDKAKALFTFEFTNPICDGNGNSFGAIWYQYMSYSEVTNNRPYYSDFNNQLCNHTNVGINNYLYSYNYSFNNNQQGSYMYTPIMTMVNNGIDLSLIKQVSKSYVTKSGTNWTEERHSQYLFAPSAVELGYSGSGVSSIEGTPYNYYSSATNLKRVKKQNNNATLQPKINITDIAGCTTAYNYSGYNYNTSTSYGTKYWLRSPYISNNTDAWYVEYDGSLAHTDIKLSALSVCPMFCM